MCIAILGAAMSVSAISFRTEKTSSDDRCFNAQDWISHFRQTDDFKSEWRSHSQGYQDSVLKHLFGVDTPMPNSTVGSLFIDSGSRSFAEFGFSANERTAKSGSNTAWLFEQGWDGKLFDISHENEAISLFKHQMTFENIQSVFQQRGVPQDVSYVSIDVSSCDLWLFLGLVRSTQSQYLPSVISIEYNMNHNWGVSKTNRCIGQDGEMYRWRGDDVYGASFEAIRLAAEANGYCVVWVVHRLDVFLVRKDAICLNVCPDVDSFRDDVGHPMHEEASDAVRTNFEMEYDPQTHLQPPYCSLPTYNC